MIFVIILLAFASVQAIENILLDSTIDPSSGWLLYSRTLQQPTRDGWKAVQDKNNLTSYEVCDRQISSDVSNWLWTPFIERGESSSIVIEIEHVIKSCNDDIDGDDLTFCKEEFVLFLYESDSSTTQDQLQSWQYRDYAEEIGTLSNSTYDGDIDEKSGDYPELKEIGTLGNSTNGADIDEISVRVNKKGFHLGIRDEGSCLSISSIKIYYETCPEARVDLIHLPVTAIRGDGYSIKVEGECVANAVPNYRIKGRPWRYCEVGGDWGWGPGRCDCKAGFQPDPIKKNTCTACPIGQYKQWPGQEECRQCPSYTEGLLPGLVECPCIQGYLRTGSDTLYMCTRPPSSPTNLTLTKVHATTATLSWNPPLNNGRRLDTRYRVSCDTFGSWVALNPDLRTFRQTSVTIENLYPETSYSIRVFSENGASHLSEEEPEYAEIIVETTESNPVLSKRVEELEHELEDLKEYVYNVTG